MRKNSPKGVRKTTCSKCNLPIEANRLKTRQRYCKSCHAENMRATRPKHGELPLDKRKKANCRAHTKVYIKRGKVLVMPCWICGEKAEAHHEDYSNPKDVIWFCREHHLEWHKKAHLEDGLA